MALRLGSGLHDWGRFAAVSLLLFAVALSGAAAAFSRALEENRPLSLQGTGLYLDFAARIVHPAHIAFSPQYALWTDGATKRRWISLPPGTAIDGSNPDAWVFPVGTRLWKEFSFAGRPLETRYIERLPDGNWLYAAYEWTADGSAARLVSERGRRGAAQLGAGRSHTIPGISDCKVCHAGSDPPVLGFSAIQLSPDRDPGALHADAAASRIDLEGLVERGLLVGFPPHLLQRPPRIAAASDVERSALGYLHANCGHCHNERGPLRNLELFLRQNALPDTRLALATTVGRAVRQRAPGQSVEASQRIEPKSPERSALLQRVGSRYPALQMPPLGTEVVDDEAVALLRRWIADLDGAHQGSMHEGGTE